MGWSRQSAFEEPEVTSLIARVPELEPERFERLRLLQQHSNDVAEVSFASGRRLVLKRARYAEMGRRMIAANLAARVLWEEGGILAPEGLVIRGVDGEPILLYWWIDYPTLEDLWPGMSAVAREEALRDWGRLLRRMHQIRLEGAGPLVAEWGVSPGGAVVSDLQGRLLPAAKAGWPGGLPAIEALTSMARPTCSSAGPSVLLHGDLFSANVLCEVTLRGARCVGVLDLEDAFGGPPEADLARTEILHGPLFGRALPASWFEVLLEGYGRVIDPALLGFFRAYHLLNMGYHAAVTGLQAHAEDVAEAAGEEIQAIGRGLRHQEVVSARGRQTGLPDHPRVPVSG